MELNFETLDKISDFKIISKDYSDTFIYGDSKEIVQWYEFLNSLPIVLPLQQTNDEQKEPIVIYSLLYRGFNFHLVNIN